MGNGVNRRTALGTMIGGIAAAPTLTEQIEKSVAVTIARRKNIPTVPPAQMYEDRKDVGVVDPFWREKRIAQLREEANGNLNKYQLRELERYKQTQKGSHIASYKSVSEACKAIMFTNLAEQNMRQEFIDVAMQGLKNLLAGKGEYEND